MAELLEAANLNTSTIFAPLKSASLSTQAYVLSLASLPGHYAALASAPSNAIDIFDKSTLQGVQTLAGHELGATCLRTVDSIAGLGRDSIVTSGKDGMVKIWDERANSASITMKNLGRTRPLLSCDISQNGMTVAAGTDLQSEEALILYWDPRQPAAPLRIHASTHSDDITSLRFFNGDPTPSLSHNTLLSASTDGLISISNADEDDEDECVLHVGNWGCSISQAGWIHGTSEANIWASSDMETFSSWSNELDLLQSLDIRGPSVHNQRRTWVTDYLITGQSNDSNLAIFVGSNEGDVALISNPDLSSSKISWTLYRLWVNGHEGVVRSLLWDTENDVLVTGGEDGKINVWPSPPLQLDSATPKKESPLGHDNSMDVDVPSNSRKRDIQWEYMIDESQEGKRVRRM